MFPELPGSVVWLSVINFGCLPLIYFNMSSFFCCFLFSSGIPITLDVKPFVIVLQFFHICYVISFFFFIFFPLDFSLGSFYWHFFKFSDSYVGSFQSIEELNKGHSSFLFQYFLFLLFPFDSFIEFHPSTHDTHLCLHITFFYIRAFNILFMVVLYFQCNNTKISAIS